MSGLVITGGNGGIGQVLATALAAREPRILDLPQVDLRDRAQLARGLEGAEQVIHLAWDTRAENFGMPSFCADNAQMTFNVVSGALERGVRRLVFASSVHAQRYWPPGSGPLELPGGVLDAPAERAAVPDGPYGASKLFGEALCRWAATQGLQCVCIRFGGVHPPDAPPAEEVERRVWLSHRDCAAAVSAALDAPLPGGYTVLTAVSDNAGRLHSLENALGWRPLDGARAA